jgi:uncharacterized protein (DUF983 family)
LVQYWKHSAGLVAVNVFNGILFGATIESCWLRALLSVFGIVLGGFWACINFPPVKRAYLESTQVAFNLDLTEQWMLVISSAIANVLLGISLAGVWVLCFENYVVRPCLSSLESFASFVLGILLLASSLKVYPKALAAESSLLLECDHILREAGFRSASKGKVYEMTCPKCRQPYFAPHPLFTRGMCKQCYAQDRFVADWWLGASAFGILLWQVGLRQLAMHLVIDPSLKWALWAALSVLSGFIWLPLVRGHWHVPFYWRHFTSRTVADASPVPPPRLLVDAEGHLSINRGDSSEADH